MKIELTPDQKAFARHAMELGRLQSEEDAVLEALALWEERERGRVELSAEVRERGRARLIGAEEWFRELTAWSESHPATPLLPDEAIDRDSIYGERGL